MISSKISKNCYHKPSAIAQRLNADAIHPFVQEQRCNSNKIQLETPRDFSCREFVGS